MALIRLEHVSKAYRDRIALSDVTLSFESGEWVLIAGPSGAGKSTLLRVLALAEKPSSGRVEVDPIAVTEAPSAAPAPAPTPASAEEGGVATEAPPAPPPAPPRRRVAASMVRRHIGILGQEFRLLPDRNIFENVAIACNIGGMWDRMHIRDRVNPLLDQMGIRGVEALFPNDLSSGQKQRVALARAMARQPRILLADEPTGNLDPGAAAQIFALLHEIRERGTLVLIATHAEEWIRRYPGRVIRMERGMVRSDGPEGVAS
ncbi:MAG TPA: ATP-binding cassette domain-containing protein [Candidatus Eisenbacteria bacterium]|nr:ATP-binding cassette domain-containing protein [Candidatus Eisenbacteria bacterium]